MNKYDIIIIGSGLGGLLCGSLLSKEGYSVCILEKHHQIGGCLQTFQRKGVTFDTGIHYVGGLEEGQNLNQYLKYFGILDKLNYRKMDIDGFDIIDFQNVEYPLAMGYDNFSERLSGRFPKQRKEINDYVDYIIGICSAFPLYNVEFEGNYEDELRFFNQSASDFISQSTQNHKLRNVLAGNNLLYAGQENISPVYIHALIQNSFINSAYRFVGSSDQISVALAENIINNGGMIIPKAEVTELNISDGKVESVTLKDGNKFHGKSFISGVHPSLTMEMIDPEHLRKTYRNRVINLENTISTFSVYFTLKPNQFKYFNYNYYKFTGDNVWTASHYSPNGWPGEVMFFTPPSSKSDKYAKTAVAMSYMRFEDVKNWENTVIGNRGDDYEEFKLNHAIKIIDLIEQRYSGFKDSIENFYTSSPLTYRDYTGTKDGSMYGISRDANNPLATRLTPKTKIPNLFFTGQNVNLHGVLGVTVGSIMTCAEFLGMEYIINNVKKI